MSEQQSPNSDETHKARDLLRDAIEALSEGFALYDEDRLLVMFNNRYKEMNQGIADILEPGLDWEILMRETARRGIYTDAIGREDKWVSDRLESGIEYIQDYELAQTDGQTFLVSVHPTDLGGFVVTKTDITEKKKSEISKHDSDLLIRTVLDASSSIVIMARIGDGQILYRSPAALEIFGNNKSAKEHYISDIDRADYVTQLLSDGQVDNQKMDFINAMGEQFPAVVSGRIVEYKGEEVIVTSITDLTEQVKTEALIRQVLEACQVPLQMTKVATGEVLFSTPETTALFGSVTNSSSYYIESDERNKLLKELREKGWYKDRKAQFMGANAKPFWSSQSARLLEFNGDEVIVSNTRDITEELAIQEELTSQREMLFQNEKMSALGELLAGVAHELNNPLSVVVGHSLMFREEATEPEAIRRIEKISNAAERCAKIVKTFLAMARQQPTKMEKIDINAVIKTAVDVASYGHKAEGLEINYALLGDVPEIIADADQITQVIINLIINAEQAISKSGKGDLIEVRTTVDLDGSYVEILVEDNGPGIPEVIKPRVFEPFFTTKEVGEGTGIGLAFCHRIIHSHGGQLSLDHFYDEGTRFIVRLPVILFAPEDEPLIDPEPHRVKTATILIVDDEVEVGELAFEILKKEGFQVDLVHSGAEAISLLETKRYDILLSDLNMPGIDGRGLYETVRNKFPDLLEGIAFITGDTMGAASQSLLLESQRPYLEKPVSPAELRTLVYNLINDKKDTSR